MRKFAKHMLMTAATVAIIAGAAPSAYAGNGVLANVFIRPFSPKLADVVDEAHARMGNPIDHEANAAAGLAADALVPGSGPLVQGALEARRAAAAK